MPVEATRKTMEIWFKGDVKALSDDVVAASGKPVRVPVCITYGLNGESKIDRGRIYVLVNSFLDQVGAKQGA